MTRREPMRARRGARVLIMVPFAALSVAACARRVREPSPVAAILAVLKDSIVAGGEATRLVTRPPRSYQHPPMAGALPALGALLGLTPAREDGPRSSCRWAPVDPAAIGMDITVTELEVVGDSAMVSVLRRCRQRQRGRATEFQLEPTWYLRRRDGRWVVTGKTTRVTALPLRSPTWRG